ncbi:DUF1761 domain-containing protein [Tsuneonella sp. SYSU-LHT278]|uniref:DUF1761 domain-containing protein n=1 Tax=Tsuneonella sediminis TaxID=3416089 RepID=UPI003F7A49BF
MGEVARVGPVNWIAVFVAAFVAGGLALAWFGPLFGREKKRKVVGNRVMVRSRPERIAVLSAVLLLVTAAMLGHMFARVGAATLAAKPWLYFMMSGGLAVAFVIPALWVSFSHIRVPTRVALIDAGYWLTAYLAMGLVFFLLA